MASFESSYANLLQGVSQQIARSRLPGQLSAQENMLSDPVTGIRRRPGIEYKYQQDANGATSDTLMAMYTDIAGSASHILVNTTTGEVTIREADYSDPVTLQDDYLKATHAKNIRVASVGDSLFLANTEVIPQRGGTSTGLAPNYRAYFFITTSAFSKSYAVTLSYDGVTGSVSFTTPDGTDASHAAAATTENIATKLKTALENFISSNLNGKLTVHREGSYVYVQAAGTPVPGATLSIVSGSGTQYVRTSSAAYTRQVEDLPALLPSAADGFIVATGAKEAPVYFRYEAASQTWVESGDYTSPTSITGMPAEIYWDGVEWQLDASGFEGRHAGDEETNPVPEFVEWGITGLSSYQGRLVILSGPWVSMSASNKPRRFFRTTVADLLDADPIHIGSSAASSAAYEYAVPFNKDLVLFSAGYQALVPAGNQGITPRTAHLVVTSSYATDTTTSPVAIGRTLMFPIPRSSQYFGLMEMLPSPYTDSQYVSTEATEHLPQYLKGRCRFAVSSSVSNIVLFGQTRDYKSVIVHEYSWDGEDKILRAWHRWNFPTDVACTYFSNELINIVTVTNGEIYVGTVDVRAGAIMDSLDVRPFMDWVFKLPVDPETKKFTVPAERRALFTSEELRTAIVSGGLGGEEIGNTYNASTGVGELHKSFSGDEVWVGIGFESEVSPTPPVVLDREEIPIASNKLTLLRFFVLTNNTSKFQVYVQDKAVQSSQHEFPAPPIRWTSPELSLGKAPVSGEAGVVVPCRTRANTTEARFVSEGLGEMNITALEYVCRYNQRIRRR